MTRVLPKARPRPERSKAGKRGQPVARCQALSAVGARGRAGLAEVQRFQDLNGRGGFQTCDLSRVKSGDAAAVCCRFLPEKARLAHLGLLPAILLPCAAVCRFHKASTRQDRWPPPIRAPALPRLSCVESTSELGAGKDCRSPSISAVSAVLTDTLASMTKHLYRAFADVALSRGHLLLSITSPAPPL